MKDILNWTGVVMAAVFCFLLFSNAKKVSTTTKNAAQSLVYVQQATHQHTKDANDVINWAFNK